MRQEDKRRKWLIGTELFGNFQQQAEPSAGRTGVDPYCAKRFERAKRVAADVLEAEAMRRALDGVSGM